MQAQAIPPHLGKNLLKAQCRPVPVLLPASIFHLQVLLHSLRRHRREVSHSLQILFRAHLLFALAHLRHHLEIVDIERRRVCIEKLSLFVKRIRECMRRPNRYGYVVPHCSVDYLAVWRVEANSSFGDQEGLVVHFVPMSRRPCSVGREGEGCRADAVICARTVFLNAADDVAQLKDLALLCSDEVDRDAGHFHCTHGGLLVHGVCHLGGLGLGSCLRGLSLL